RCDGGGRSAPQGARHRAAARRRCFDHAAGPRRQHQRAFDHDRREMRRYGAGGREGGVNGSAEAPGSSVNLLRRFPMLAGPLLLALMIGSAAGQESGGVLRIAHRDSPASMSPLEEVTISTVAPMMAVFNNLVMFDQHVPQNTLQSIVPDLATSWSWNADGAALTFRLREGVHWHD